MAGSGFELGPLALKSDTEHVGLCLVSIFTDCFILRANRDSRIYAKTLHVPCSRILYYADIYCLLASEAQRRPGLLSLNPTGVGIRHTANGAPMHAYFHYRFNNIHILSDIS